MALRSLYGVAKLANGHTAKHTAWGATDKKDKIKMPDRAAVSTLL